MSGNSVEQDSVGVVASCDFVVVARVTLCREDYEGASGCRWKASRFSCGEERSSPTKEGKVGKERRVNILAALSITCLATAIACSWVSG